MCYTNLKGERFIITNLDLIRDILLKINERFIGESILIDDLNKEFPDVNSAEFLDIIARLVHVGI